MKELSIMEMDYVSGAADTPGWGTGYIWDFSSAQSAITSLANNLFQAGAGLIIGGVGGTLGGMAVSSAQRPRRFASDCLVQPMAVISS